METMIITSSTRADATNRDYIQDAREVIAIARVNGWEAFYDTSMVRFTETRPGAWQAQMEKVGTWSSYLGQGSTPAMAAVNLLEGLPMAAKVVLQQRRQEMAPRIQRIERIRDIIGTERGPVWDYDLEQVLMFALDRGKWGTNVAWHLWQSEQCVFMASLWFGDWEDGKHTALVVRDCSRDVISTPEIRACSENLLTYMRGLQEQINAVMAS